MTSGWTLSFHRGWSPCASFDVFVGAESRSCLAGRHPFFDSDRSLNREGLVLRRLTRAVALRTRFFDDRTTAATVAAGGDSLVQDVFLGLRLHRLSRAFAVFGTLGCGAPAWPPSLCKRDSVEDLSCPTSLDGSSRAHKVWSPRYLSFRQKSNDDSGHLLLFCNQRTP